MGLTAFFGSVKTAQRQRLAAKSETFEELARQVADDESLDPDEVADKLDLLDRSADELATAAQLIVDRRAWSALIPRDAELHAEHNRLFAEQEAATAQHVEAIRLLNAKHAERVGAIQQRLATIATERDAGQTARNKLMQTSPLRQRLGKLYSERSEAVRALEGPLHVELRKAKPGDVGYWQAEISRAERKRDQLDGEIAQLEREALLP